MEAPKEVLWCDICDKPIDRAQGWLPIPAIGIMHIAHEFEGPMRWRSWS